MSVDAFLAWADAKSDSLGLELVAGRIVRKPRQNVGQVRARASLVMAFRTALPGTSGWEVFGRGLSIRTGRETAYEPDLIVRNGVLLPGSALEVVDAVVVGEVIAAEREASEAEARLWGYMGLPSVRHYLIITTDTRIVTHHARRGGGVETRIMQSGPLRLEPPGIEVMVGAFVAD